MEAFMAMNALGPRAVDECKSRFCNLILNPYKTAYSVDGEIGALENTGKRFAWLKRTLKNFKDRFEQYFPIEWLLPICICQEFCRITRENLEILLERNFKSMDMALFVTLYVEVKKFEGELYKKFTYEQNNANTYELGNYQVITSDGKVTINAGSVEEIKEKYGHELKIVFLSFIRVGCT